MKRPKHQPSEYSIPRRNPAPDSDILASVLAAVLIEGRKANAALSAIIRENPRWRGEEVERIVANVYELIRFWRLGTFLAGAERAPLNSHVVNRINRVLEGEGIDPEQHKVAKATRAIRESIPDWLDLLGAEELGVKWDLLLRNLNESAQQFIRINLLKTNAADLASDLGSSGIRTATVPGASDALIVLPGAERSLFRTAAFSEGKFEVQDLHSQAIAPFCEVGAGMRVVDACAGEGGKTLHLANLMQGKGRIIALDVSEPKLAQLKKRVKRTGFGNIEIRLIDRPEVYKRLRNKADRVLIDVPCSGLGALRRHPEIRWQLSPEQLAELQEIQAILLRRYARLVKPGGKLVYSTCSVLPSENEIQVQGFLKSEEGAGFTLEAEQHLEPAPGKGDGFYMARMYRLPRPSVDSVPE